MTEHIARNVLTHATCLVTGFALAAWSIPQIKEAAKPRFDISTDKSKFSVIIPIASVENLNEILGLRGKKIRIVRKSGDQRCVIDHTPLQLEILDRTAALSGPLSSLESFYLNVLPSDILALNVTEFGTPATPPSCILTPKITYGE